LLGVESANIVGRQLGNIDGIPLELCSSKPATRIK